MSKDKFRSLFAAVGEVVHRHRFYIVTAAVGLAVALPAVLVARSAYARAQELERVASRVGLSLGISDVWLVNFEARSPEEARTWDATRRAIADRGVILGERVTIAQDVTQRAEQTGIRELRIRFMDTPEELLNAPPCVPGWPLAPLPTALSAELLGDYAAVSRFLHALPEAVEARQVTLERVEDLVRARVLLIMYERQEGDATDVG